MNPGAVIFLVWLTYILIGVFCFFINFVHGVVKKKDPNDFFTGEIFIAYVGIWPVAIALVIQDWLKDRHNAAVTKGEIK